MFLPIGDEPNLRGTPYVTYILIGLNVLIFVLISWPLSNRPVNPNDPAALEYLRLLMQESGLSPRALLQHTSAYDIFIFQYGFKPAAPSVTDLFISMFLHAGWLHLLGNMLFLWIYGDNVELHVGRVGYILIYLITGITATALHAIFRLESNLPMVGASGAISGILGCYFLWFPRNYVRVLVWFFFFINVIHLPARLVLGFYLIIENLLPFMLSDGGSGVAYGAHLGGFIGGLGCAALITNWRHRGSILRSVSRLGEQISDLKNFSKSSSPSENFQQAVEADRWKEAVKLYTAMSARDRMSLPDEAVIAFADWMVEQNELDAALAILQRFIANHTHSNFLARAFLRAGMIHLHKQRLPAAYQNFLAVLDLEASPEEITGARDGLTEIEKRQREARRFRFH